MDQGAILVVCRENDQWRQVGTCKCADDRHHGSYIMVALTDSAY